MVLEIRNCSAETLMHPSTTLMIGKDKACIHRDFKFSLVYISQLHKITAANEGIPTFPLLIDQRGCADLIDFWV